MLILGNIIDINDVLVTTNKGIGLFSRYGYIF